MVAMAFSSKERTIAMVHALVIELSCRRERRQGLPSSQGSYTSGVNIFQSYINITTKLTRLCCFLCFSQAPCFRTLM